MGEVSVLTVTGVAERKDWLIEAALSVQREKDGGVSILWLLCVRGEEVLPSPVEEIADFIIRVPFETHVSDARNALLRNVRTKYVCTLDDDDMLLPGGLYSRIEALEKDDELDWVAGHMQDLDIEGNLGDIWLQPATPNHYEAGDLMKMWALPENWFICISHSFLMRLDSVLRFGGWKKISQEDILLVCQVSEVSKGRILPDPTIGYRRHDSQISRSQEELDRREEASRVIFEEIARMKQEQSVSL